MAANIVPSLFGLSRQQVQQQQLMQDQQFAQQQAAMQAPMFRDQVTTAATLGSGVARGIAGLFGLQTQQEQRASQMDEVLKSAVASLPPEARNDRGAVMGRVSEMLMGNPEFVREGLEAQFTANAFNLEDTSTKVKIKSLMAQEESAIASADLNKVRVAQETLDNKQKQLQIQGQIATGSLEAYKKNANPGAQGRIWNNTLKGFENLGMDTAPIKDLPESERQSYLEQVVQSSKTSIERIREDSNVATNAYRTTKLQQDKTKNDKAMAFKQSQATISNNIKQSAANLASSKYTFEQKKVIFEQGVDLLRANERQLDDIRNDLQDTLDERTKLEGGKQFGLSEEETEVRKAELDARILSTRSSIKQGELILNQNRKQLEATKFNPAPGMTQENPATPTATTTKKTYMSDGEARSKLGTKYKPGYKFFIEGGRIKGDPA